MARLPNNLIVDLEGGTELISALKVSVTNMRELQSVAQALKAKKQELGRFPYDFVTIDTITELESWAEKLATHMYKQDPKGSSFQGDNVLTLPNGAGYYWLRLAFNRMLSWFEDVAPTIILVAHLREKSLDKGGVEILARDLDLTGKLRTIVSSQVDAIGYLYRDAARSNELRISFKSSESVLTGTRIGRLAGQDFVLLTSEQDEQTGEFHIVSDAWDLIFNV